MISAGPPDLLIRNATLRDGRHVDVQIRAGRVCAIGKLIASDMPMIDAGGGLLIPGLHDHHIHVAAAAAARDSVRCGPPQIGDADALRAALACPGEGWLRGIGYHESIAGMIDRHWLDLADTDRPIRVQHRSGRMWFFNSIGVERLLNASNDAAKRLERDATGFTGRLFEADAWLRTTLSTSPPSFRQIGEQLAAFGVTGLTDMTVSNDRTMAAHFAAERASGALPQRVVLAGNHDLAQDTSEAPKPGPYKVHLHEAHLPDYTALVADIARAHGADRVVAVHCVTEAELVFTLAAFADAETIVGDRIEHASLCSPELADRVRELGLAVVTQPNFIHERGNAYLADLPVHDWPNLYRLQAWRDRGVALAGGTDAPFGEPDPWAAMAAAVSRRTATGATIGGSEALTSEAALDLFLADPRDLSVTREVAVGVAADLCLLTHPWSMAREALSADLVATTIIDGRVVHNSVDEANFERGTGANAPAR